MNPLRIPLKSSDRWDLNQTCLAFHGEGKKVGTSTPKAVFFKSSSISEAERDPKRPHNPLPGV